ncbi:MAG: HAD hydrolase family protein [Elusimicrobiaceae bacterium]|nr:HAD hydrolase family protein [Elusimicrobiaceae bacterium]
MDEIKQRASRIKAILTDVDGILTDGKVNFFVNKNGQMDEFKSFHTQDGVAALLCQRAGITLGIITGRRHATTVHRAQVLGYSYIYQGFLTKLGPLNDILKRENLQADQVAYIGDDITDLPLLKAVGFAATVPGAVPCVKEVAHFTSSRAGGDGAYREIIDFILESQGKLQPLIQAAKDGWGLLRKPETKIITSEEGLA